MNLASRVPSPRACRIAAPLSTLLALAGIACGGGGSSPTEPPSPGVEPSFTLIQALPLTNDPVARDVVQFDAVFRVILGDQSFGEIETQVFGTSGGSAPCDSPTRVGEILDLAVARVEGGPTGTGSVDITVVHVVDLGRLPPEADSACVLYLPRTPAGPTRTWLVGHPFE